jgi:hypothetical protein
MSTFHLQGLEDQFDRKSRRRLDAFIVPEGAGSVFKQSEKIDENEVQAVHSGLALGIAGTSKF